MRKRDLLERIDRHMERGNEHMDRGNELMDRSNEHMDRGNELMDRSNVLMDRSTVLMDRSTVLMDRGNVLMEAVQEELRLAREQHADLRVFIREMNLRAERFTQGVVNSLEAVSADLRDLREESRAQSQALLLVLDRIDPGRSAG